MILAAELLSFAIPFYGIARVRGKKAFREIKAHNLFHNKSSRIKYLPSIYFSRCRRARLLTLAVVNIIHLIRFELKRKT